MDGCKAYLSSPPRSGQNLSELAWTGFSHWSAVVSHSIWRLHKHNNTIKKYSSEWLSAPCIDASGLEGVNRVSESLLFKVGDIQCVSTILGQDVLVWTESESESESTASHFVFSYWFYMIQQIQQFIDIPCWECRAESQISSCWLHPRWPRLIYLVDDKTHTPLHRWPGENLLRSSSIYIFGMASYLLSRQLALSLQRNLWLGAPGKSHTTLFEYICFSLLPCSFSGHALLQMPPEQKCGTAS